VARLPVDRSFVLRGFGSVVTGTLVSGTLSEGDEVEILPAGKRARIRGLQVHHQQVPRSRAGQRTAVNLQGVHRDDAPRGATLAHPGTIPVTRRAWARLRVLPAAASALRRGGTLRFHQGTCERAVRLRLLESHGDDVRDAELVFREDTVLLPGDAFILRRPAPLDTMGGGTIVDVRPPVRRAGTIRRAPGEVSATGAILERVERAGAHGRIASELATELGMTADELSARLEALEAQGRIVRVAGAAVTTEAWESLREAALRELLAYHRDEPLRAGLAREDLRARVARGTAQEIWRAFLERLQERGEIRLAGELVASAEHHVRLVGKDLELARRLEGIFRDAGLDPPDPDEVVGTEEPKRALKLLAVLQAEGRLVKIRDGRFFHAEALKTLREKLRRHAREHATIDVPTFKELAGVTRKNAIPLLEQLDAERFTRRVGNVREILAR
jgi:selenocysteine-specific elongation factor